MGCRVSLNPNMPEDAAYIARHAREWFLAQVDGHDGDGAEQYADWLVAAAKEDPSMIERGHVRLFAEFYELATGHEFEESSRG